MLGSGTIIEPLSPYSSMWLLLCFQISKEKKDLKTWEEKLIKERFKLDSETDIYQDYIKDMNIDLMKKNMIIPPFVDIIYNNKNNDVINQKLYFIIYVGYYINILINFSIYFGYNNFYIIKPCIIYCTDILHRAFKINILNKYFILLLILLFL